MSYYYLTPKSLKTRPVVILAYAKSGLGYYSLLLRNGYVVQTVLSNKRVEILRSK